MPARLVRLHTGRQVKRDRHVGIAGDHIALEVQRRKGGAGVIAVIIVGIEHPRDVIRTDVDGPRLPRLDRIRAHIHGHAIPGRPLEIAGDLERIAVEVGLDVVDVERVGGQAHVHELDGVTAGLIGECQQVVQGQGAVCIPEDVGDHLVHRKVIGLRRRRGDQQGGKPQDQQERKDSSKHEVSLGAARYHLGSSTSW